MTKLRNNEVIQPYLMVNGKLKDYMAYQETPNRVTKMYHGSVILCGYKNKCKESQAELILNYLLHI